MNPNMFQIISRLPSNAGISISEICSYTGCKPNALLARIRSGTIPEEAYARISRVDKYQPKMYMFKPRWVQKHLGLFADKLQAPEIPNKF